MMGLLSPQQVGTLVISALNLIPMYDPHYTGPREYCCPQCCAPCGVLCELDRDGLLDAAVQLAPPALFDNGRYFWWVDGKIDRAWMYAAWRCEDSTTHWQGSQTAELPTLPITT